VIAIIVVLVRVIKGQKIWKN